MRQEISTYECLEVRRPVHMNRDEYIRQETSTYECLEVRRPVHTVGDEYLRVDTSPRIESIKQ